MCQVLKIISSLNVLYKQTMFENEKENIALFLKTNPLNQQKKRKIYLLQGKTKSSEGLKRDTSYQIALQSIPRTKLLWHKATRKKRRHQSPYS